MFSFHKPKVYRSSKGCCICKAKSSSSRFTDSKKYEDDFMHCFKLEERRTGEICNACVLLVKRYKKLPAGSTRHWHHVVDRRVGPGIKSLTKFKSKNKKKLKENIETIEKIVKKKHVYRKPERNLPQSPVIGDELSEEYLADGGSKGSSRSGSPEDCEEIDRIPDKDELYYNGFIDMTYFKRVKVCCGIIFKGLYGEIIVDPLLIKRCGGCMRQQRPINQQQETNTSNTVNSPFHNSASTSPAHSASSSSSSPAHSVDSTTDATVTVTTGKPTTGKTFSDSSSDSGYDESSNQGVGESKLIKTNNIIKTIPNTNNIKMHPIKTIHLKTTSLSETVRLTSDVPIKLVPIKQVDKLTYKPITNKLSSSTIVSTNPLVDFARHASARQSITN